MDGGEQLSRPASPLVSAVVITWNRMSELRGCLYTVAAQDYPNLEIIVVDNGSTDGTAEMVRHEFPAALLVVQETNLGCSPARVLGTREARGEYVFFMDDDARAEPTVVSALVARLQQHPHVAVIVPRVMRHHAAAPPPPLPPTRCVGAFSSCAVMMRRSALEEIGGFPPDHFYGAAELDLGIRFMAAGHRMEALSTVLVWHRRTPLMRDPRREFRLSYRNAVRSLWRRAPLGHALVATLYMVVAWGRAGRRRGYGLTHLQATLGLGHDIARILWRRERHPVSAEPYCLMEYLTDHWVSSWDEVDGSRVHRYGALWRKAWRRLRGRRLVSLTDGPGRPQAGVGESP